MNIRKINKRKKTEKADAVDALVRTISSMGYPEEFGYVIAENLRTEKMITRMTAYLRKAKPTSAEEIADEMLAIMEQREQWINKKKAEYYNRKYNELLWYGIGEEDE